MYMQIIPSLPNIPNPRRIFTIAILVSKTCGFLKRLMAKYMIQSWYKIEYRVSLGKKLKKYNIGFNSLLAGAIFPYSVCEQAKLSTVLNFLTDKYYILTIHF